MLSLVLAGRSGARIRLFDYGVHSCAALASFTLTDAACTSAAPPRLGLLVSYRSLATNLQVVSYTPPLRSSVNLLL